MGHMAVTSLGQLPASTPPPAGLNGYCCLFSAVDGMWCPLSGPWPFDNAVLVNAIPDNIPVGEVWVVTTHFSGYKTEALRDEMSPQGTQQNSREVGKYYLLSNYLPDLFILIGN